MHIDKTKAKQLIRTIKHFPQKFQFQVRHTYCKGDTSAKHANIRFPLSLPLYSSYLKYSYFKKHL